MYGANRPASAWWRHVSGMRLSLENNRNLTQRPKVRDGGLVRLNMHKTGRRPRGDDFTRCNAVPALAQVINGPLQHDNGIAQDVCPCAFGNDPAIDPQDDRLSHQIQLPLGRAVIAQDKPSVQRTVGNRGGGSPEQECIEPRADQFDYG